ncbi:uncharacterized protein LOC121291107 isoform X3 [Carcharodon carcharias]|uniref:uncharacterized protein LOC121291107 isoform X3 n=1 Tax=Carcharodon carcharias TaxID=13397 RepID=UPI001B7EA5DB|nr:uncharacterized protein LOC121291107 isoform X3 [Carcharodon carcharias]
MWLWQIPMLILAFVGPLASIELSEPTGVQFDSVNFNNTLRWTQKGSQQTVYDVEYRIYGETKWKNKTECHHITAHYCDLTNEIVQDNNWYYARVMAISKNANSTWSLSERFCPLDKSYLSFSAIIGAPAVEYTAGNRSITVFMHLPQVPLRQGVQRSIKDIFATIEYEVQLKQSLTNKTNLDRIVLHERVLLEESSPTLQLVTSCKKDTFQFVQVIHMDNLDLLKYDSIEKEEIMKAKELTLTAELNSYAPQSHTRIQQAKLSGDTACEIQSNSSSKPTRSGRSSSYCPQATNSLSNNTYSNKNNSRALTQNYATIVHMTSQNSTKLNTDPRLSSAQKVPLNSLQTMSEDLLYNIEDLIFQNGLELEMQKLKLKEEKPMLLSPFLSLLDDKPQTYQSQWKENQPIETPLLVSLKDQKQINLPLFQHGQQIDSQSLLSLLKDEVDVSYLQSDRTDNQPIKVSLTGVLQTELKDGQLAKALLEDDTFTRLLHVTPEWEDGYKRQLLTSHSSTKQGQQTNASFLQTSQTNATMEGCKFLEDWEIQVHMDE